MIPVTIKIKTFVNNPTGTAISTGIPSKTKPKAHPASKVPNPPTALIGISSEKLASDVAKMTCIKE